MDEYEGWTVNASITREIYLVCPQCEKYEHPESALITDALNVIHDHMCGNPWT
jgi:hypothetical protein